MAWANPTEGKLESAVTTIKQNHKTDHRSHAENDFYLYLTALHKNAAFLAPSHTNHIVAQVQSLMSTDLLATPYNLSSRTFHIARQSSTKGSIKEQLKSGQTEVGDLMSIVHAQRGLRASIGRSKCDM